MFLLLAFSIDVVDLTNRTAGHSVATIVVVGMAMLQLPDLGQKVMPFAVLLGGVFAFARLSRSQELVAIRAAGMSAWDFLAPPLAVAAALGIFVVMIITPISARMLGQFSALEAKYIKGEASQLAVSRNGLWLRQGDERQQSVIHALRVTDQGVHLEDVIVFLYGANDHFLGRVDAKSAQLQSGTWMLKDAWVSGTDGSPVHHDDLQAGDDADAGTNPGKLRSARHVVVLGTARISSALRRAPDSRRRATNFISTHCSPCRRCSRRWCSWQRASRCVSAAMADWRA